MPYSWVKDFDTAPESDSGAVSHRSAAAGDEPWCELRIWANNSLAPSGFVTFVAATAVLMALPLLALLGKPVLWVVLLFLALALAATWWAIRYNQSSRERTVERLWLWEDKLRLNRQNPTGDDRLFEANPYWLRVTIHKEDGPVEDYLTLQGGPRVVELGAFLVPEERRRLAGDLELRLARLRHVTGDYGKLPPES
ncbi:DUF2244 domain-containing protein [Pseudoroseicyclus sp. H15]